MYKLMYDIYFSSQKRQCILYITLLVALSIPNLSWANPCNRLYVAIGINTLIANNKLLLTDSTGFQFQTSYDRGNLFGLQFLVGDQWLFREHFLAAEFMLRGDVGRSSGDKLNAVINTPRVALPATTAITLKAGTQFNNNKNLLYGLFGIAESRISMHQTYNNVSFNLNKWRPGIFVGLGLQANLTCKCAINLTYQYEWYSSITKFSPSNNFLVKLNPSFQSIAINVLRYF